MHAKPPPPLPSCRHGRSCSFSEFTFYAHLETCELQALLPTYVSKQGRSHVITNISKYGNHVITRLYISKYGNHVTRYYFSEYGGHGIKISYLQKWKSRDENCAFPNMEITWLQISYSFEPGICANLGREQIVAVNSFQFEDVVCTLAKFSLIFYC